MYLLIYVTVFTLTLSMLSHYITLKPAFYIRKPDVVMKLFFNAAQEREIREIIF